MQIFSPVSSSLPCGARRPGNRWLHLALSFGLGMSLAVAPSVADPLPTGPLSVEVPQPSNGSQAAAAMASPSAPAPVQSEATQSADPDPLAPALKTSIEGINFDEDGSLNGFLHIPPDPHGAVGPSHVVSVVNTSIEWHTKAGAQQKSVRLGKNGGGSIVGSFFEPLNPANGTFDPKVIYDQFAGRFLVVTLELVDTGAVSPSAGNTSRILLAVSNSSDPNGTWNYFAINSKITTADGVERWADYPGFAVDGNAVYITNNLFAFNGNGSGFGGVRLWIVNKTPFYSGGAGTFTVHDPYASAGNATTTQPAHIYGGAPGGNGTFLTSYGGLSSGGTEFVQVVRVDNPLNSPTFSQQFVNVGDIENSTAAFPNAPQKGSTIPINTGDRRLINAVWRSGFLYGAASTVSGTGTDTGQTTAHWFKLNTSNLSAITVSDQGNIGGEEIAAGTYTYYPSVAVSSAGDLGIAFAASGSNLYGGAYYTGRNNSAAAGTTQAPGVIAAGQDFYVRTFTSGSTGRNRWGDYSAISLDPSDGLTFWSFNEYALTRGTLSNGEDGRWGTKWGSFALSSANAVPTFVGAPYTFVFTQNRAIQGAKVTATDADNDALTYSLSGGTLPAGITFNANGTFSGTPTATASATTFTVTVSDGKGGSATAQVTLSVTNSKGVIISEFRFRGAGGSADEYVELYNTLGTPLDISGWSIKTKTGSVIQSAAVPANTILPARGHFLFTGGGYSLAGYGASNASIGTDVADDSGVALLDTGGATQDAVGFTTSDATLREGAGLASTPTINGQYAFMRDFTVSLPKDSGDSTNDFVFVSTAGNTAVAGTGGNITPQLGAPSPEGLASPVYVNNQVSTLLLDSGAAQGASPNRVRLGSGDSGTLIIRRKITNSSGRTLNRVRFTVTRITSLGSATTFTNQADIRLITSPDEASVATSAGSVAVSGTTLESPSAESPGGALGSSVSYNAVLSAPLAPGATGNYAFRFNINKAGSFLVALNIEALPNP